MSLNETGVITVAIGCVVVLLGALLLVDKALIIIGNLLMVSGFIILLRSKTLNIFHFDKLQGALFFISGIFALIMKYVALGILLESVGIILIFKNMIPDIRSIIYRVIFKRLNKKD